MENKFLVGESCERCRGPLLAEPVKKGEFLEDSLDYTEQTFWLCFACGHMNALDSQPHYVI